jgi:hypothetical protein
VLQPHDAGSARAAACSLPRDSERVCGSLLPPNCNEWAAPCSLPRLRHPAPYRGGPLPPNALLPTMRPAPSLPRWPSPSLPRRPSPSLPMKCQEPATAPSPSIRLCNCELPRSGVQGIVLAITLIIDIVLAICGAPRSASLKRWVKYW